MPVKIVVTALIRILWAQIGTRREIRARYGIRGNACDDCIATCFCPERTLIQERREIELEESSFL
jgi:Cys-rich protein (TIGR01571 family)